MEFDWSNLPFSLDRSISLQDIEEAFEDPFAITIPDVSHSEDEPRSIILGLSLLAIVLLVVHTERNERIRIISARKATPSERFQYESER